MRGAKTSFVIVVRAKSPLEALLKRTRPVESCVEKSETRLSKTCQENFETNKYCDDRPTSMRAARSPAHARDFESRGRMQEHSQNWLRSQFWRELEFRS